MTFTTNSPLPKPLTVYTVATDDWTQVFYKLLSAQHAIDNLIHETFEMYNAPSFEEIQHETDNKSSVYMCLDGNEVFFSKTVVR